MGANQDREGLPISPACQTLYMRMMRYFQEELMKLPIEEQTHIHCCNQKPQSMPFWSFGSAKAYQRLVDCHVGRPSDSRKNMEPAKIGIVINTASDDYELTPDGSSGEASIGVDVKLSSEGEILIKSFHMFSKYLNDPKGTREAHTADGYYRTGDIARKEGKTLLHHWQSICGHHKVRRI